MITTDATEEERESPFFLKNREFAVSYEKFILQREGEIQGLFNAIFLDLQANFSDAMGHFKMEVFRQLNFVTLDETSQEAMYTQRCVIRGELKIAFPFNFSLHKKEGLLSVFSPILHGYHPAPQGKNWLLKTSNATKATGMLNTGKGKDLSQMRLKKIRINQKRVEIQLDSIPEDVSELESIFSWIEGNTKP